METKIQDSYIKVNNELTRDDDRNSKRVPLYNSGGHINAHNLVRKMHRTTYWGYSLSWYNLAGERAKWWEQKTKQKNKKQRRERDENKERREENKKEKNTTFYILQGTFCRQPSIVLRPPSGDRLLVRITLSINLPASIIYPIKSKHRRRQDLELKGLFQFLKYIFVLLLLHIVILKSRMMWYKLSSLTYYRIINTVKIRSQREFNTLILIFRLKLFILIFKSLHLYQKILLWQQNKNI